MPNPQVYTANQQTPPWQISNVYYIADYLPQLTVAQAITAAIANCNAGGGGLVIIGPEVATGGTITGMGGKTHVWDLRVPPGFTMFAGAAMTGTTSLSLTANSTSTPSPAGATPTLSSFSIPGNTVQATDKGFVVRAWGVFANNANAKTVSIKYGATTLATVTATASTANSWMIEATILIIDGTHQTCGAYGFQGPSTPTFAILNTSPAETLSGAVACAVTGTQTAAADITQNGFHITLLS